MFFTKRGKTSIMALGLSSGNGEEETLDLAGGNCDTEAKIKDLILICEPEIIASPPSQGLYYTFTPANHCKCAYFC